MSSKDQHQGNGARSEKDGAGQSGSDRGTSQYSSSSRREEAEHQQGKTVRGRTDAKVEQGREEHESTGRSRRAGQA